MRFKFLQSKSRYFSQGITSIVALSDLQGRETGQRNRLIGEQVVDELIALQELGMISDIDLVILAGDLYDYPDCRKLGGTGDVTNVLNAFANKFEKTFGVLGNHDKVTEDKLLPNVSILDGNVIKYQDWWCLRDYRKRDSKSTKKL